MGRSTFGGAFNPPPVKEQLGEVTSRWRDSSSRRAERYEAVYFALIGIVLTAMAFSPVLRYVTGFTGYGRYIDVLMGLALVVRAIEMRGHLHANRAIVTVFIMFLAFLLLSLASAVGDRFVPALVMIEGKIFIFFGILALFGGRKMAREKVYKLLDFTLAAFAVGVAFYAIVPSTDRLSLLDESNYMMLSLSIITAVSIRAYRAEIFSKRWVLTFSLVVAALVLSKSRTGLGMFLILITAELLRDRSFARISFVVLGALAAGLIGVGAVFEHFSRGQTSLSAVDRFVFVREYISQLQVAEYKNLFFNNAVGTYFSSQPIYMGWWSAKLSADQGVPYGLAPYHFHSEFLRLFSLIGVVPAVLVFVMAMGMLRKYIPMSGVIIIAISAATMSVFHISAFFPFLMIALLATSWPPDNSTAQANKFFRR